MPDLYDSCAYHVKRIDYTTLVLVDKRANNVIVADGDEMDLIETEAYLSGGYSDALCSCVAKMLG